jgi:hypothetical protein
LAHFHTLEPERRTLHGHFSRDLKPVLTIQSGDTIRYRTLESGWRVEPHPGGDYVELRRFLQRDSSLDDGHALIGPVAVEGAQPGKMLQIDARRLAHDGPRREPRRRDVYGARSDVCLAWPPSSCLAPGCDCPGKRRRRFAHHTDRERGGWRPCAAAARRDPVISGDSSPGWQVRSAAFQSRYRLPGRASRYPLPAPGSSPLPKYRRKIFTDRMRTATTEHADTQNPPVASWRIPLSVRASPHSGTA